MLLIVIVSVSIGAIFGYWLRAQIDFCVSAATGRKILKVMKIVNKVIKENEVVKRRGNHRR